MKDYYEGEEGTLEWDHRKQAFLEQEVVVGLADSDVVARKLTDKAKIVEYQENETLYEKASKAEFVYFILDGRIQLERDGEVLASLGKETSVGEYPLIGVSPSYYVTAIALRKTVVALVSYSHFEDIAREHPNLWKRLARKLAGRMNFPREEDAAREHLIVLVHGIRTFARWQPMLKAEFENVGLKVASINYDFFDLIRFLAPWKGVRRKTIEQVEQQLRRDIKRHPDAKVSILAHSFGSYIVAEILADRPDIDVYRLAFCGSIVPHNHRFISQLGLRIETDVINDVGSRDVWPALANSVTRGYGHTGTYGFRCDGVKDRWFKGLKHSDFLNPAFCKKNWIPFFKEGRSKPEATDKEEVRVTTGETDPIEQPPFWLQAISVPVFKLKFVVPLLALGALLWWKGDYFAQLWNRVCA